MKKWLFKIITCFSIFLTQTTFAEDLLTAYHQALNNDPQFKNAQAQWLANRELRKQSLALLLPTVSASATMSRTYDHQGTSNPIFDNNKQVGLNASQPIFDYAAWAGLKGADAQVKQARANYDAAQQNLMIRVATAYLAVLQAYDQWEATHSQKESLKKQLAQTQAQYKVGLISIIGVEQVKASYDAVVAQEIANQNDISNRLEELRAITGNFYRKIASPYGELPLISPVPSNINAWVHIASKQNYTLLAAHYGELAARENIEVQRAGHMPSANITGNYVVSHDSDFVTGRLGLAAPMTNQISGLSLTVKMPVYQGGLISAQTRQASYQYAGADAQTEQTYRSTLTATREAYLGVTTGINKLKADHQAVISNEASLNATQAGYNAGNNTIVDVLQQQSNLYTAKTTYTTDQYNYLLNHLNLKQAAGTLSSIDLAKINTWFQQAIDLSAYDFNSTPLSPLPIQQVSERVT